MNGDIDFIMRAAEAHHAWYHDSLLMIASSNLTSRKVRLLAASDLAHRYAEGVVEHRFYQGCGYIDEIEAKTIELAEGFFGHKPVFKHNIVSYIRSAYPRTSSRIVRISFGMSTTTFSIFSDA